MLLLYRYVFNTVVATFQQQQQLNVVQGTVEAADEGVHGGGPATAYAPHHQVCALSCNSVAEPHHFCACAVPQQHWSNLNLFSLRKQEESSTVLRIRDPVLFTPWIRDPDPG
jgi:hypothetical protein